MYLEYWFSTAVGQWLVAEKATGELLAQFNGQVDIVGHFMPEIIEHRTEQCDCSECEEARENIALSEARHISDGVNGLLSDYIDGGYGDAFR